MSCVCFYIVMVKVNIILIYTWTNLPFLILEKCFNLQGNVISNLSLDVFNCEYMPEFFIRIKEDE